MVLTPTQICKRAKPRKEYFLSPILPGLNMDLPSLFCTAVGLLSTQPVILSFGWTQLIMAGNLGDLLRVNYFTQYGLTIPQEMLFTGVSLGTPLAPALVSLWADVNWSTRLLQPTLTALPRTMPNRIWSRRRLLPLTEARTRYT